MPSGKELKHERIYYKRYYDIYKNAEILSCKTESFNDYKTLTKMYKEQIPTQAQILREEYDTVGLKWEIAMPVIVYANLPTTPYAYYLLFDIGGGTLSTAMFDIDRSENRRKIWFVRCDVKKYGLNVLAQKISTRENNMNVETVIEQIIDYTDGTNNFLTKYIDAVRTKGITVAIDEGWKRQNKQKRQVCDVFLIITGGGKISGWYQIMITGCHKRMNWKTGIGMPEPRQREIPQPSGIDFPPALPYHRFLVAHGLSLPQWEEHNVDGLWCIDMKKKDDLMEKLKIEQPAVLDEPMSPPPSMKCDETWNDTK